MADDKLTTTELRKTISKQMSLPEETASRFLAALVPAIMEGLQTDGLVRISGLGTFKLVQIAPRKSVNIHSGETIVLDGYNKVTFVPESYIREQINEPFADLEAVRVDENGQPLDPNSTLPGIDPRERFNKQADEIKGILAEMSEMGMTDFEQPEEETPAEPVLPAEPVEETPAEPVKPKKAQKPKKQAAPEQPAEPKKPEEPKGHGWVVALVTILVLLAMLVAGYFFLVNKLENWANQLGTQEDEFLLPEEETEAEILEMEPLLPIDSATLSADSAATETITEDTVYQPTILAIETVKAGSRLAQIARRYYGDPDKWEVIYEANKEVIKDPNNLQAGTKLRIPKLQ